MAVQQFRRFLPRPFNADRKLQGVYVAVITIAYAFIFDSFVFLGFTLLYFWLFYFPFCIFLYLILSRFLHVLITCVDVCVRTYAIRICEICVSKCVYVLLKPMFSSFLYFSLIPVLFVSFAYVLHSFFSSF